MSDFRYYRPNSFPPLVKNLIIINVLVFVAQLVLQSRYQLTDHISLYPLMPNELLNILIQNNIYEPGQQFYPYQIATHMFAHSTSMPTHILFNMFGLWMFGRTLENVWGPKRFLTFYLICGVGAAVLHLTIQYFRCEQLLEVIQNNPADPRIGSMLGAASPALGASGAVMGILAAFAFLFPNTELFIMFLPIPIKAKWAVLGFVLIDLFGGVANFSGDNVAHFAHLGGALTGFLLVLIWNKTNRKRFY